MKTASKEAEKEPETESEVFRALIAEYFTVLQDDDGEYVEVGLDELQRFIDKEFLKNAEAEKVEDKPEESPIPMKAGDKRVLVNGKVIPVDFRIVAEDKWKALQDRNALLEEENKKLSELLEIAKGLKTLSDSIMKDYEDQLRQANERIKDLENK